MLLERISEPAQLRQLPPDDLDRLAAEIRSFLVSHVSLTGGHLGSNLGVVELTIALHRTFDSPRDVVLFDTGHQAYVHKLLTGRAPAFATLRQAGGLSGYPNRRESPHDWIENSHASTALSYAAGLAAAHRLQGADRRVVAVVGDGALTGGMAYEALNNLGYHRLPVVVVLNDNGRSYAPTVSLLPFTLSRTALNPLRCRAGSGDADPPPFFEALGLDYVGPVDGHDVAAVEAALREAAGRGRPVVVHVLTRKGRGYAPAEDDDEKCLHDVSPFDLRSGPVRRRGPGSRYTDVFSRALVAAGERDPSVVVLTAAMPGSTGILPFRSRFPGRCFDVGIAEQHCVTAAAGLAMAGLRPVVAVYSTFLTRAFDQVNLDVGLHGLPVVFCIDRAGITGPDGPSHHGLLDLALLAGVPGMTVFAPSSAGELEMMLAEALTASGPCALRWPNAAARPAGGAVGAGRQARRIGAGHDVCLLAVGRLVAAAEDAADRLAQLGLAATVWDVRVAAPLDPAMLADAARHPAVVTAEDGVADGGIGQRIAARLAGPDGPAVAVLGTPREYLPHGDPGALLAALGLDGAGIAGAALRVVAAAQHRPAARRRDRVRLRWPAAARAAAR
jgi:1-deoxy-D-xylulose-5-phosphate synthase